MQKYIATCLYKKVGNTIQYTQHPKILKRYIKRTGGLKNNNYIDKFSFPVYL